ncbi:hypothetical protein EDB80DRAFT_727472 [Ilyonectria destructans]|nr:hypothetical protein EDB80DRAFT_727472 [Ilyonectria destructans]
MTPQSTAAFETENPENDAIEFSSDSDAEPMLEKWHDVVKAIEATTREALFDSPSFDSSPVDFKSYWHRIFAGLQDSLTSNPKIPEFLTAPPVKKFTITLFDESGVGGCPCCLPDVTPNISLENKDGVTKGDLINAFREYMYGSGSPEIHAACDTNPSKGEIGGLVYSSDWMSCGYDGQEGEKAVFHEEEPNIIMYCCGSERFKEKIEAGEQAERAEQQTEK